MRYRGKTELSAMYCTKCGKQGLPVFRKTNQHRESGHLKKLYCINCHKEVNHCEIRVSGSYSYADFLQDFNNGVFADGELAQ